jgi:hypothetical protein
MAPLKVRGSTPNGRPGEIQSVRLSDVGRVPVSTCLRTCIPTLPFTGRAVADQDSDAFSDWGPCAADARDDAEDPPGLAFADANFEKLTGGLGAHADEAAAF